jgi:hypothetical protein
VQRAVHLKNLASVVFFLRTKENEGREKKIGMKIPKGLGKKTINLSGVAFNAAKNAVLTTGKLSINKTSEIAGKIAKAVGAKAGGLASATLRKIQSKIDTAPGKTDIQLEIQSNAVKKVGDIENLAKSSDEGADAAAEAAKAADAAKPGAKPGAKPSDAVEAAETVKDKKKKQVRYARIVGVLLAIAAASATAAVVMDMYADRARKEREVCLARWETTYLSIIKDENGELLEIDSAEKWSENLIYLEKVIEARPEVNYDPEKANDFLVEMYNGLAECIEIDDSPIGSFLRGVTADVGSAFGNLVDPIVDPVNKIIASSADVAMYVGIALGAAAVLAMVILIIRVLAARNQRANDFRPVRNGNGLRDLRIHRRLMRRPSLNNYQKLK